ncbi:MAG: hypothetical protein QM728_10820 [Gordonia sp. (in: high G+C Gram-positive bacteria)]|uniref:hypothetical protein n=1 Tax=Gordonia sp. (in: high G+C Gram-positive bacteria) TaxID=84139 RepID=UPI0039E5A16C
MGAVQIAIPVPAALRAGAAILIRGAHQLQIGCDPERSTLVDLPPDVYAYDVADLLDSLREPGGTGGLRSRLDEVGLSPADFDRIVAPLRGLGAITSGCPPTLRVCLHGRGPVRDGLSAALSDAGYPLARSSVRHARPWRSGATRPTLVVLTDFTHHDPLVVTDLMRAGVPHLPVRLRDGVAVVGPLVLPGRSSCLRCADHHRATLDPGWPQVCAQLVNRPGYASDAVVRLAVGAAVEQIEQISAGLDGLDGDRARPDLVERTLEIHARPLRLRHKDWPAHPHCFCGARWRND